MDTEQKPKDKFASPPSPKGEPLFYLLLGLCFAIAGAGWWAGGGFYLLTGSK